MSQAKPPRAPAGTGGAGRRLWASIVARYELEEHERALLVEAERTLNLLADLDAAVRAGGAVVDSPQGMKAYPAAVEARQQRVGFAPRWPLCGSLPVASVTGRPMPALLARTRCAACMDSVQAHHEVPGTRADLGWWFAGGDRGRAGSADLVCGALP